MPAPIQMFKAVRGRLRAAVGEERGTVLAVVAVSMVALLGMAALAIDLSSFDQAQRQAQSAADAGALAGAQDLPGTAVATQAASKYAVTNDPGASVNATASSSQVTVSVTTTNPTFFGKLFGYPSATVSARAVAGGTGDQTLAAVFAMDTSCGGLGIEFSGKGNTIDGAVHSNGSLSVQGGPSTYGPTGSGGPNSCTPTWSTGKGITFNGASSPSTDSVARGWPAPYTSVLDSHTGVCAVGGAGVQTAPYFDFTAQSPPVSNTVYCATGQDSHGYGIYFNGSGLSATNVTFIAEGTGNVYASGSGMSFTPNPNAGGLLVYQASATTFQVNGQGFLSGGTIFAPNAEIDISGAGSVHTYGFIEAKDVFFNGGSVDLTGTGPPVTGGLNSSLLQ